MDNPERFLAALEEKLAKLADDSEREARQADGVVTTLDAVSGTASTPDRAVLVTVDSGGAPTELVLTDDIAARTPAELAGQIMTCVRTAQTNLADSLREQAEDNPFAERIARGYEQRYPRTEPTPATPPAPARDDENFGQDSFMIPADSTKEARR